MPLPATHLYYIQRQFRDKNLDPDFLLGNILPDIRYALDLARETTHFNIFTKAKLVKYIKNKIPANIELHQKKIIVGMFCHSYYDSWWRKGVCIDNNNPFIKPALFLAEEQLCKNLLDKNEMVSRLSLVQRHSIFGFNENKTAAFVGKIISHLQSATFNMSPFLQFLMTVKGWTTSDVRNIEGLASILLKDAKFIEQTNFLKNDFWEQEVIDLIKKYALQENNLSKAKRQGRS